MLPDLSLPPRVVGLAPFRSRSRGGFAVSPDGRLVVVAHREGVELFDDAGARVTEQRRDDLHGPCLFLDDATLLLARHDGGLTRLTVDALRAGAIGEVVPVAATVLAQMVLSPDGARVAVACGEPLGKSQPQDKAVRVLDVARATVTLTLKGMRRRATDLAFSPDGSQLAVAGDSVVRVFELTKGKALATLGDEDDLGVAWRTDDELLTLGAAKGLRAWSMPAATERRRRPVVERERLGPRIVGGDAVVVTGGAYQPMTVRRFDGEHLTETTSRAFDPLTPWAASPVARGDVLYVQDGMCLRALRGTTLAPDDLRGAHTASVSGFAVHPSGRWAATSDEACNARLWDLDAGAMTRALPLETERVADTFTARIRVRSVAFSRDAPRAFFVNERGGLRVWDAATGEPCWSLDPAVAAVTQVLPTPDGDAVLTFVQDGAAALLDAGGARRWTSAAAFPYAHARWSDDDVTLSGPRGSERFRRRDGALLHRVFFGTRRSNCEGSGFAVSDDGMFVASASYLGLLVVWRADTGDVLCEVNPRTSGLAHVTGLAWAHDGALLVLDHDRHVDRREPTTLASLSRVALPTPARWAVVPTRGGRRLVVPTHEGSWLVYDAG